MTNFNEEFDRKIPERILNEDNPQYVLGWNACRYLAKQFFISYLSILFDELKGGMKEVETDYLKTMPVFPQEMVDACSAGWNAREQELRNKILEFMKIPNKDIDQRKIKYPQATALDKF